MYKALWCSDREETPYKRTSPFHYEKCVPFFLEYYILYLPDLQHNKSPAVLPLQCSSCNDKNIRGVIAESATGTQRLLNVVKRTVGDLTRVFTWTLQLMKGKNLKKTLRWLPQQETCCNGARLDNQTKGYSVTGRVWINVCVFIVLHDNSSYNIHQCWYLSRGLELLLNYAQKNWRCLLMCVHMQAIKISSDEIFIISCAYLSKQLNIY